MTNEINENEFEYNGKKYVEVEEKTDICDDCAFSKIDCGKLQRLGKIPECCAFARDDLMDVRFVEKGKE